MGALAEELAELTLQVARLAVRTRHIIAHSAHQPVSRKPRPWAGLHALIAAVSCTAVCQLHGWVWGVGVGLWVCGSGGRAAGLSNAPPPTP